MPETTQAEKIGSHEPRTIRPEDPLVCLMVETPFGLGLEVILRRDPNQGMVFIPNGSGVIAQPRDNNKPGKLLGVVHHLPREWDKFSWAAAAHLAGKKRKNLVSGKVVEQILHLNQDRIAIATGGGKFDH